MNVDQFKKDFPTATLTSIRASERTIPEIMKSAGSCSVYITDDGVVIHEYGRADAEFVPYRPAEG